MTTKNNRQLRRVPGAQRKTHLGNIYILSNDSVFEGEIKKVFGQYTAGLLYIPYSPVCINDVCQVNDNVLAETAKSRGANVFTQVFMPDQDAPMFLFDMCDKASLGISAIDMLFAAENFTQESVCNAIKNFAINDPEKCSEWLSSPDDANDVEKYEKSDLLYKAIAFDRCTPAGPSFKGVSSFSEVVSPRQAEKMKKFNQARENFVKYVQELQNGQSDNADEAEKMIDLVLKDISEKEKNKVFKLFINELDSDKLEDFFNRFIDLSGIPFRSKIKLTIEKSDDCINNDGFYRLYYKFADFEERPLHFKHKSSCIVYLMLLLCRKKDQEMKTFFTFDKDNVADKDLFVKLMTAVYGKKDVEAALDYSNLFSDGYGVQGRLKDYIKACRDLFDETIGNYESPYPFIPQKIGSSGKDFVLPILPDNIIFTESFTKQFPV